MYIIILENCNYTYVCSYITLRILKEIYKSLINVNDYN